MLLGSTQRQLATALALRSGGLTATELRLVVAQSPYQRGAVSTALSMVRVYHRHPILSTPRLRRDTSNSPVLHKTGKTIFNSL